MHLGENFAQAFISLKTNKLRSILTMLGIVMGVFSVVAIMAISNATKAYMTKELNKMGANTITIGMNRNEEYDDRDQLIIKDMENILEGVEEVEYVAGATVFYSEMREDEGTRGAIIQGITTDYEKFMQFDIIRGRFLTQEDVDGNRRVIIIPDKYAEERFGTLDVLGEEIVLYNYYGDMQKYKIIGVVSTDGDLFNTLLESMDYPVEVTVPLTCVQTFFGQHYLDQINVSAKEGEDLQKTGEKIIRMLEFTHGKEKIYQASNVKEIQKSLDGMLSVISNILLVIAVITLIVGGIGIINILLVSVTERIREIGLRKAIGAKKKDIVLQFLTESVLMTSFSGMIGILLGLIAGMVISNLIKIPPIVDFKTAALALMGSIALGIIFGVYPAMRAADLDPIESLRYE